VLEELSKAAVPDLTDAARRFWAGAIANRFFGNVLPPSAQTFPKNRVAPFDTAIWAGSVSDSETDPAQIRIPPRWRRRSSRAER